jgi:hypothetical protein
MRNTRDANDMWVIGFLINTAFVVWLIFYGGAEQIEGKIESAILISPMAPLLTAPLLKLYAFFAWVMQLVFLVASQT